MTKAYDASKEFKPFANRGKGGSLVEDAFSKHPRTRTGKRASSLGKPRGTPNVRVRVLVGNDIRNGYSYLKV